MTIREYMEKNKLNIDEFTKLTGLSKTFMTLYLNGYTKNLHQKTKDKLKEFGILEQPDTFYTVYKGEAIIISGTIEECAEKLGVKPETIRWKTTPSGNKKAGKNGIRVVREGFYTLPVNQGNGRYTKNDEGTVVEKIRYIIKVKNGCVWVENKYQVAELKEWLRSRKFSYRCKEKSGQYEIKFEKVG